MIDVSISYGFGEGNRQYRETIPDKIQLAIYKYDIFWELKEDALKALENAGTDVRVIHLPLDTSRREKKEIMELIEFGVLKLGCTRFVIHPNKNIYQFVDHFLKSSFPMCQLCVETFQWRKKKEIRGPLEILELCVNKFPKIAMTLDTSHIESIWFDHRIMPMLLKYTTVIHLSNRARGHGQHMPFNSPHGELKLVGFVRDLKHRYNWTGDLVLEYMPEHKHKLMKNKNYIERLLA